MTATKPTMNMPELLVFAKSLAIGFLAAEVWWVAFYLGANFAPTLSDVAPWVTACGILLVAMLCITYAYKRGAFTAAARMGHSFRLDLLAAMSIGVWMNELASPWLAEPHAALQNADPYWAPTVMLLLCAMMLSPLFREYWSRSKRTTRQLYFMADEEIGDKNEDLLASEKQAQSFAETVLASGAHPGLIFGVEGPWELARQVL